MSASVATVPNASSIARFGEETRDLFVQRTRIGCMLTLTLVPAGSLLDYVSYPERFYQILVARLLCTLVVAGIYVALRTPAGRRHVLWLSAAWGLAPALTIAWMIYLTEGGASPFYAGLNLVILGTCVLVPFTLAQAAVYGGSVYVAYAVACAAHGGLSASAEPFVANSIFILMTCVICVTFCHFNARLRRRDFQSREEIERQNRELRTLDEMKTRFFANVSHELRTPLTLILAPVQELLRDSGATAAPSLRTIERSAQRLSRLIDDLLELVRLDSVSPAPAPMAVIDANRTLRALAESALPLARTSGLELALDLAVGRASILANEDQFERAILNLISNAVKFTPAGGQVTIATRLEEDAVVVEVRDTGRGIAEQDIPRLTERFVQVDGSETRKHQGLGLGLALVKGIADSHGATLTIRSRLGQGSAVALQFRRASPVELAAIPPLTPLDQRALVYRSAHLNGVPSPTGMGEDEAVARPHGPERGRILIADDEVELREFLRETIGRDYEAYCVADGDRALEWARREVLDLVVLDMMMPGRSGLEVCRALRSADPNGDCKIVMLTARVDERLKIEALEAGADDFLFKPFSLAEVSARVGNLVKTARLQRALRTTNVELRDAMRELGETQAQLVQSEKMNALGGLAAGILHEFKNPLNHALLAISVARKTGASAEPEIAADLEETLSDAEAALRRIDQIASDLRAFAHPEKADAVQSFLLAGTIADASRFLNAELADVRLDVEFDPRLQVACPRTHLVQLFVNLLSNAAAAVAETAERRSPRIVVSAERDDERVTIRVRDNGVGIPPERLTRIFEPFYTTKPVGAGTGLGLTVCHAIVARWEASLAVASEPDAWTEFTFEVPFADSGSVKKATA